MRTGENRQRSYRGGAALDGGADRVPDGATDLSSRAEGSRSTGSCTLDGKHRQPQDTDVGREDGPDWTGAHQRRPKRVHNDQPVISIHADYCGDFPLTPSVFRSPRKTTATKIL